MTTPEAHLAQVFQRLRGPLARVELATSQLVRAAGSARTKELVEGISDAVREIDREIVGALRSLRPRAGEDLDLGDCREALEALRRRMAPILEAQDVRWAPLRAHAETPWHGDRAAVVRAAMVVLRAAIARVGPGGSFELDLRRGEEGALGVRLVAEGPAAQDARGREDPFAQALFFALQGGGSLDVCHRGLQVDATLWLAPGAPYASGADPAMAAAPAS